MWIGGREKAGDAGVRVDPKNPSGKRKGKKVERKLAGRNKKGRKNHERGGREEGMSALNESSPDTFLALTQGKEDSNGKGTRMKT